MRSAVITIIKLDLDTSTDQRQVKLKSTKYCTIVQSAASRLAKAMKGTDKNKTIESL